MISCQHCGKRIPYDANLCPYCGRSIKQFQQKEVLQGTEETPAGEDDAAETNRTDTPHTTSNDKKMLYFVVGLLTLLLIVGGIYHYTTTRSLDDEQEEELPVDTAQVNVADEVDKTEKGKVAFNPKKKQQVVVNGEGVRMRFGPSLKSDFLKDEKGATKSVKKGTRLDCVGEKDDWYQVVYQGKRYYMSKQYTYIAE